jgi:hypothetical protein
MAVCPCHARLRLRCVMPALSLFEHRHPRS